MACSRKTYGSDKGTQRPQLSYWDLLMALGLALWSNTRERNMNTYFTGFTFLLNCPDVNISSSETVTESRPPHTCGSCDLRASRLVLDASYDHEAVLPINRNAFSRRTCVNTSSKGDDVLGRGDRKCAFPFSRQGSEPRRWAWGEGVLCPHGGRGICVPGTTGILSYFCSGKSSEGFRVLKTQ